MISSFLELPSNDRGCEVPASDGDGCAAIDAALRVNF